MDKITKKEAESPYLNAARVWQERYGEYIKAAANWRFTGVIALVILAFSVGGNVMQARQQKVVPYIVRVDDLGRTHSVNKVEPQTGLPAPFIQSELSGFIQNWRTVTADFDLQKKMVNKLSAYTAEAAKGQLREWYEKNNPYQRAKNGKLVQVEIRGLPLPVSKNAWRVEWTETSRSHSGILLGSETFEATLSVKIQPPVTENQVLLNPGGILITEVAFAKVFDRNLK